jgi:hypothetical protein
VNVKLTANVEPYKQTMTATMFRIATRGGSLAGKVRTMRADGASWRAVEKAVNEALGDAGKVSYESLRKWYPDTT